MLYEGVRYTALEVLTAAGVEKPEEYFGKQRVIIGGIRGIVTPDHLVKVQKGSKKLEILAGDKGYQVDIVPQEGDEPVAVSDEAKKVVKVQGEEATKKADELQKAKAEAKKVEVTEE